jgi:energy-coupling factor transport system permease protein
MIGKYVHGSSSIHQLDPRTKLVLMLGMGLAIYGASPPALLFLLVFVLLLSPASGMPVKRLLGSLRPVLLFFGIILLMHMLFTPGDPFLENLPFPTVEGVWTGGIQVLRFILLILYTSILIHTTSPSGLNYALMYFLRPLGTFVTDLAFMTGVAMTLIPYLFREITIIKKAQTARGYRPGGIKGSTALVVPLLNRSFHHVDELSDALESRCFYSGRRNYYYTRALAGKDFFAGVVFLVISILIFKI